MQEIETARLYLRQFTPDDLDELTLLFSQAESDAIATVDSITTIDCQT